MEFPHLLRLIDDNQFDTIYHEHFSYFSLPHRPARVRGARARLFDVEELPTHGGSLRIYGAHDDDTRQAETDRARELPSASGRRVRGPRHLPRLRARRAGREALHPQLPHRPQGPGTIHRRLRRARQGQHDAQLLRRRHRLPGLHRRPQSPQAGAFPARQPHPDLRARSPARDDPDSSSSSRGTCARRSWASTPTSGSGTAASLPARRRCACSTEPLVRRQPRSQSWLKNPGWTGSVRRRCRYQGSGSRYSPHAGRPGRPRCATGATA